LPLLRLLIFYVTAVVLVASAALWAIFEYNLLPFNNARAVVSEAVASEPTSSTTLRSSQVRRRDAGTPAIIEHDLTGRRFKSSPLPLSLPIDCEPGVDCWVFNFVDLDPGKGRRDFACGQMSYDTHKGTDFALSHFGRINDLVPVRAAASGRVLGSRDGMKDISVRVIGRAAIKGKECGNGVRIDHGGGWHTQYCHMKRGTVLVGSGDLVRAGDRIGAVGLSGLTEFPHLHLTVEKDGEVIDPFIGLSGGEECDVGAAPLWRGEVLDKLRYLSGIPYNIGFAGHVPKVEEFRAGKLDGTSLSASSKALVFWAEIAGLRPKDVVATRFYGPDGGLLAEKEQTIDKHKIRIWTAVGKKSSTSWPTGVYRGEVTVQRKTPSGLKQSRREARLDVY